MQGMLEMEILSYDKRRLLGCVEAERLSHDKSFLKAGVIEHLPLELLAQQDPSRVQ